MQTRFIKIFALTSGLTLTLAGMVFILWMPPGDFSVIQRAVYLLSHRVENFIYVFSVLISNILIIPVFIVLTIKLFVKKPATAIVGVSIFIFAIVIDTVANLASLSMWAIAIPEAARGDIYSLKLFDTLQMLYVAVDIPCAILVYIAAIIYTYAFWNIHRIASLLLIISTALILIGGPIGIMIPVLGTILSGSSIIIYGIAYITIGDVTDRLVNNS